MSSERISTPVNVDFNILLLSPPSEGPLPVLHLIYQIIWAKLQFAFQCKFILVMESLSALSAGYLEKWVTIRSVGTSYRGESELPLLPLYILDLQFLLLLFHYFIFTLLWHFPFRGLMEWSNYFKHRVASQFEGSWKSLAVNRSKIKHLISNANRLLRLMVAIKMQLL